MSVELTVVVENTAVGEDLLVEHGLAVHVSCGGQSFMFDTGFTPEVLSANAAALCLDLAAVEAVVISHGHPDHTGGLPALLAAGGQPRVYAHHRAFARRWAARPDRPMQEITWHSSPDSLAAHGAVFCRVDSPHPLTEALLVSGPIGGPQPKLDHFVVQVGDELIEDSFRDEMFLMIGGAGGWAVLTGCCHRGLRNTLRTARFLARGQPIRMVLGGFHLGRAGPEQLADAAAALEQANPEAIYPCHCTGKPGREYLTERFPGKVKPLCGGMRLSI